MDKSNQGGGGGGLGSTAVVDAAGRRQRQRRSSSTMFSCRPVAIPQSHLKGEGGGIRPWRSSSTMFPHLPVIIPQPPLQAEPVKIKYCDGESYGFVLHLKQINQMFLLSVQHRVRVPFGR